LQGAADSALIARQIGWISRSRPSLKQAFSSPWCRLKTRLAKSRRWAGHR
jgi:hypothetical protein